ncbi:dihydropteroate synthase [Actinopolymorpha cephalotaxi]|uniref:Dihydropteroate synthase n=2 Tax=Actinopolymorpha cephalotaxi TaxID=504797 RepID=A0A1I2ND93_9ACTN|nr:dihydropteroate synthase [Actinopolymorpha cephalotaxi]SFG01895.1 dihydropteroate synthase [Actinopolymorpha cephalotaxi]
MRVSGVPTAYLPGLPQPRRALVMGVLNVTPDSFSDGGRWLEPDKAIAHGHELLVEGADLLDVGGESTRPGADRPSEEEELARVLPVVRALAGAGALVSVDTMRSRVAQETVEAGAVMVNDVSGGLADPRMLPFVAAAGIPYICMHWRAHSARMQEHATYDDVVETVVTELGDRLAAAEAAGIAPELLAIDPGLGFAKTGEHNWALLAGFDRLASLGRPVLVAASRKAFLGNLLADPQTGQRRRTVDRDDASAAVAVLAAAAGAWCVRAHAVRPTLDGVRVAAAWGAAPAGHDTGHDRPDTRT